MSGGDDKEFTTESWDPNYGRAGRDYTWKASDFYEQTKHVDRRYRRIVATGVATGIVLAYLLIWIVVPYTADAIVGSAVCEARTCADVLSNAVPAGR